MLIFLFLPPSLSFGFRTVLVGKFQPAWEDIRERCVARYKRVAHFKGQIKVALEGQRWGVWGVVGWRESWDLSGNGPILLPHPCPCPNCSSCYPHGLPHSLSSKISLVGEGSGWNYLLKGSSLHSRDLQSQGCGCSRIRVRPWMDEFGQPVTYFEQDGLGLQPLPGYPLTCRVGIPLFVRIPTQDTILLKYCLSNATIPIKTMAVITPA